MSVEAMAWVLGHSEETLGRRLVLIALANYAHADGSNAFPSVGTLARDARLSERQVHRALRGMEADGSIARDGESRYGTTVWTIRLEGGDNLSGVTNRAEIGHEMSPDPSSNPSIEGSSIELPSSEPLQSIAKESLRPTSQDSNGNGNRMVAPGPGPVALCRRLAELMLANDPKAKAEPESKRWLDAARLLVDSDGRHFEEALAVLEWTQRDEFERTVVLSMPKFRQRYPQLRLKWQRVRGQSAAAARGVSHETPASTADLVAAYGKPRSRTGL